MAGDGELARPAEHGSARNAGRVQQDQQAEETLSRETPQKTQRTLFKGWRSLVFLLAVFLAIGFGLHFKTLSEPGQESKQLASGILPSFNIFVSDPRISVHVTADIFCLLPRDTDDVSCTSASSSAQALLSVTASSPRSLSDGTVLMTSNVGSFNDKSGGVPFSSYSDPPGAARIYQYEFHVADLAPGSPSGVSFDIPDVLEETHGSTFGRLPTIGNLGQDQGSYPSMLTEDRPGTSSVEDLIYVPSLSDAEFGGQQEDNPSAFMTLHGGHATLFWRPTVLSITEELDAITEVLSTQQLDYMTPSATVSGQAYFWNSNDELQPDFKSTDPEAADSQSNNAFIAGICLGIAGAAAIALLQELPQAIPLPSWSTRRRRTPGSLAENN